MAPESDRIYSRVKVFELLGFLSHTVDVTVPVRRRKARQPQILASRILPEPDAAIVEIGIGQVEDIRFMVLDL